MSDETHLPARCWVSTTNLDHVLLGVAGGYTQGGQGQETRLRRLRRGDGIAFYSPRAATGAGRPLQQLTALGTVADDEPYRADDGPDPQPWRRRVEHEDVAAVPIQPLLPLLGFIPDEPRWGMTFRRGLFEVPAGDFGVLAGALRDAASVPVEFSSSGRTAR